MAYTRSVGGSRCDVLCSTRIEFLYFPLCKLESLFKWQILAAEFCGF